MLILVYGVLCYLMFFGTFLYAIGFTGGMLTPTSLDAGISSPTATALAVNVMLMSLFAVQHSVMARRWFKAAWTRIIPAAAERSTYVLLTNLCLILLFWQWRPLPGVVWDLTGTPWADILTGLFWVGWGVVFVSTFLLNHFELFGLQQVWHHFKQSSPPDPSFRSPLFYRFVRHPIYFGFTVAFWATPVMTRGHLLFAAVTTVYMVVAIQFEEKDLVAALGDAYADYRKRVSMIWPWIPRG